MPPAHDYAHAMKLLPERIDAPRLTIRRWESGDAPALRGAIEASIEHLRPWMAWVVFEPISDPDREALIASWRSDWQAGGDAVYGAFVGDTVVGGCGLHRRSGPGTLEIGYWVHADHLRNGYATEIAASLTTAALSVPDISRVEIHHDQANTRSASVPRTLGYHFDGESPDEIKAPAEVGVDWSWSMAAEGWNI